jgi:carbon storage regulator
MLVLSRKPSEVILIGDEIRVTVIRIGPNAVRLGIDAPEHVQIVRAELLDEPQPHPLVETVLRPREREDFEKGGTES